VQFIRAETKRERERERLVSPAVLFGAPHSPIRGQAGRYSRVPFGATPLTPLHSRPLVQDHWGLQSKHRECRLQTSPRKKARRWRNEKERCRQGCDPRGVWSADRYARGWMLGALLLRSRRRASRNYSASSLSLPLRRLSLLCYLEFSQQKCSYFPLDVRALLLFTLWMHHSLLDYNVNCEDYARKFTAIEYFLCVNEPAVNWL